MDGKIDSTVGDSSEQFAEEPGEEKDTPTDSLKQSEATDAPRNDTSVAPAVSTESAKQSGGTETPSISTLEEKIIRQIEFYFGDRNFPRDKYLQQAVSADESGWVPLTYLLNFNRLKDLSTDVQCIYNALCKATADVIEVKQDGNGYAVRRNPNKPASLLRSKEESHEIKAKSVSVKGFPLDVKFDDIQHFFDQYGKMKFILMRRTFGPEKKFKGSVFAEFETKAEADKFLGLHSVQYQGQELFKESKEAYFVRQKDKHRQPKLEGDGAVTGAANGAETQDKGEQPVAKTSDASFPAGAILHFKGCGGDTSREDIKEAVGEFADVVWIDFSKGCTEGYMRFKESGGAQKALDGLTAAGSQLNGAHCVLRVLEGDEEKKYWSEQVRQQSKGGGRGRGRGGRGRGGGRNWKGQKRQKFGEDGEGQSSKRKKQHTDYMGDD
eukprot:Em0012g1096a